MRLSGVEGKNHGANWRLACLAVGALFAATACGSARPQALQASSGPAAPTHQPESPAPLPGPTPTPVPVVGEIDHPRSGARLRPTPVGVVPAISGEAAYETFLRDGLRPKGAGSAVRELMLTLYSNDSYGTVDATTGKVNPTFQNVLAWAVMFKGVIPTVRGGVTADGPPATINPSVRCDFVYMVDATSGKYMMAFEDCPSQG